MMSDFHAPCLRPIPEDLRLFPDTLSEEEQVSSEDFSLNYHMNAMDSGSDISSLSIDDRTRFRPSLSTVPPLDLASRDSSLLAANDPFREHSDINLRSESEDEVISEPTNSESIPEPSPSRKWNQLNERLQRIRQDKRTGYGLNGYYNSCISVHDQYEASGHTEKNSIERFPKIDYVKENRTLAVKKPKPSGYSYQTLHQMQNSFYNPVNLLGEKLNNRSRGRSRYKSDINLEQVSAAHAQIRARSQELMNVDHKDDIKTYKSPKESKVTKRSPITYCLHPRATASQIPRRFNLNQLNLNHPEKDYYVHSASSSGVYRLCQQQQTSLELAHHKFREKYTESCPTPLFTRFELQFSPRRPIDRTYSARSPSRSQYLEPLFPDPFVARRLPRSESVKTENSYDRYTVHDYSLLPNVFSQIGGLGPDLQSDEYKTRLAKRNRQKRYGDQIREKIIRRRSTSNRGNKLVPMHEINDKPGSSFHLNDLPTSLDRERTQSSDMRQPIQCGGDAETTTTTTTTTTNEVDTQAGKTNELATIHKTGKSNLFNGETGISSEKAERKRAAEKREAMLSYGNRVRTKMSDKRKRQETKTTNQNVTLTYEIDQKFSGSNLNGDSFNHSRLADLLRRHEEDRKFAQSVQHKLRIIP